MQIGCGTFLLCGKRSGDAFTDDDSSRVDQEDLRIVGFVGFEDFGGNASEIAVVTEIEEQARFGKVAVEGNLVGQVVEVGWPASDRCFRKLPDLEMPLRRVPAKLDLVGFEIPL